MNARKRLKHRARLSFEKPWGYTRSWKGVLLMWNTKNRGGKRK